MKNASAKNTVAVLFVTVMALALSVGAFAGTAHAQYEDYGDGNVGYFGGSYADTGWYDIGSEYTPDTGWYDVGSEYTPDTGWYDVGSEYTPETGWYDVGSEYIPETAWYDVGSEYTPSYSPSYSSPSYSSPSYATSYGSSLSYSSAPSYSYVPAVAQQAIRANVPTYAAQYIPSYVYSPTPSYPSRPQPTYTAVSTPAPTYNTNTNANTNTNTPTAVATATNGDNINTNVASTGAITNTFAPVINVNGGSTQRPAQYEFPRPVCTIYSSGSYNQVTLTWSSQNATTAYISPNVGSVPVNGSRTVYSQGYTTFTLTVSGPGGSATCQTAANYAPSYSVAPTYPVAASPAPYVALSQIPYTGFDYGPMGNAIYWSGILAFAAAAGYLLVYGMPKLAFAGFARKEESPIREASPSNGAGTKDEDIAEVFQSSIVPATELVLPIATSSHAGLTSDAMIIDRSNGTPRIVIARA